MSDLWREPDDTIWALQEAAKVGGFMPHAKGTVGLLQSLEASHLLRQADEAPVWYITKEGRDELARLEAQQQPC